MFGPEALFYILLCKIKLFLKNQGTKILNWLKFPGNLEVPSIIPDHERIFKKYFKLQRKIKIENSRPPMEVLQQRLIWASNT